MGIDHDENTPEHVRSDTDVTGFVFVGLCLREGKGVIKYSNGICEVDPVLSDVGSGFRGIPLEVHRGQCMHIRAYRQIPQVKALSALAESLTASSDSWATTFGNPAFPRRALIWCSAGAPATFVPLRLCARSRVLFLVTRQKREEATEWPSC